MGRNCKVCNHEDVGDINRHLIMNDITQADLARMYGISKFSLSRHKKNHLGTLIEEIKNEARERTKADVMSTIDALNLIIGQLPDMVDNANPSYSQALEALKQRSNLLGETVEKPQIEIVWGMGTPTEDIIGPALSDGDSKKAKELEKVDQSKSEPEPDEHESIPAESAG